MAASRRMITAAFLLSFAASGAFGEDTPKIAEVRALLREAAGLVPQIDAIQQPSAASNIARQQVLAGDLPAALETVHALKRPPGSAPPDGFAYTGIAATLATQGKWQLAMDLVHDLPADDSKAVVYLTLAQSLAAHKDFEHALLVAQSILTMPNPSRFADTLVAVSNRQFEAGDPESAAATLHEALDVIEHEQSASGINASGWYTDTIERLMSAGNISAASSVLERLFTALAKEKDPRGKELLLRSLAQSQARIGDFAGALSTADRLAEPTQHKTTLLAIATEQARQGDTVNARRLVADLRFDPWPDFFMAELAKALSKSGDNVNALAMIKARSAPKDRAYAFAFLALDQAERKDSFASLTATLAMEDARLAGDAVNPSVLEFIAVTRGVLGDFSGARQLLLELKDEHSVWPLWNLTEQLVAAGRSGEALALANAQQFPQARAYALLGAASAMWEQIEAARDKKR